MWARGVGGKGQYQLLISSEGKVTVSDEIYVGESHEAENEFLEFPEMNNRPLMRLISNTAHQKHGIRLTSTHYRISIANLSSNVLFSSLKLL